MRDLIFYIGLGLLCSHELDAMPNHEWRVLPILSELESSIGQLSFVIAHVPLFAVLIGMVASLNIQRRLIARQVVSIFLVVHVGLHWAFSGHPHYDFSSILSSALIYGAGVCGAAYLLLERISGEANAA